MYDLQPSDSQRDLIKTSEKVRKALVQQLEKDLHITFSKGVTDSGDFLRSIAETVQGYFEDRFRQSDADLPELLYRIDVDENALLLEMKSGQWSSYKALLAQAVVVRDLAKVVLRLQLSGKI